MSSLLTGPSIVPTEPRYALICLHGFGADGDDFITLHAPLASTLPPHLAQHLALFSPHAPQPTPFQQGRQWFSDAGWTFNDPHGTATSSHLVWLYLQHLHTTHSIPYAHMVLFGFSQGCMQALYSATRFPHPIAGLIGHSGRLMHSAELQHIPYHPLPTLLLHGVDDDIVPADSTMQAEQTLTALGFPVQAHLLPHLSHGLNAASLAHFSVFLTELFPK